MNLTTHHTRLGREPFVVYVWDTIMCADCGEQPDNGTGICDACDVKPENAACSHCGLALSYHRVPGPCEEVA
jgi:predicted amidophosphoribosyltransferase